MPCVICSLFRDGLEQAMGSISSRITRWQTPDGPSASVAVGDGGKEEEEEE